MMRYSLCSVLIALAALCGASPGRVRAQTPASPASEPVLRSAFAGGTDGWITSGGGSKIASTRETEKAALRWDYSVQKGDLSALALPVSPDTLAKATALHFSVKCAVMTPLVVVLQEKNGGRYVALFTAPADKWQTVELALGDFVLAEGKTDPKDDNKQLDLDQIENVAIADLTQFVVQSDNAALVSLFGAKTGEKRLFLADWAFYGGAGSAKAGYDTGASRMDTFTHPQVGWAALNATSVKQAGKGLEAAYRQSDEHPLILTRAFPTGLLIGKTNVGLTLVSDKPAKIVVQLETRTGNKWKTTIDQVGQKTRKAWQIPFADFAPDEANAPVSGKAESLDFAQVHQITLIDISGITDGAIDDTVLSVSDVIAK